MDDHIIAGYDGSPASAAAARWAATEAELRHASLTVVGCHVTLPVVDFGLTGPAVIADESEALRTATRKGVDSIVTELRAAHPALSVSGTAVNGSPRSELLTHAEDAGLLVIGTTGAGQANSWLLGSVAHVLARTSPCPIALVPVVGASGSHGGPNSSRVVVGIGEAKGSDSALEWAIDEADLRRAELTIVHAWSYPYGLDSPAAIVRDVMRVDAARALDRAVERANSRGGARVDGRLIEGNAAESIIDAAEGAGLIVVGSRGRGGLRSLLLGSVSSAVIHDAQCPTVVVRDPR